MNETDQEALKTARVVALQLEGGARVEQGQAIYRVCELMEQLEKELAEARREIQKLDNQRNSISQSVICVPYRDPRLDGVDDALSLAARVGILAGWYRESKAEVERLRSTLEHIQCMCDFVALVGEDMFNEETPRGELLRKIGRIRVQARIAIQRRQGT